MRLRSELTALGLLAALAVSREADAGAPGWVDDAIAAAPECAARSDASATMLFAERRTSVRDDGTLRTRVRTVVRLDGPELISVFSVDRAISNDRSKVLQHRGWRVEGNGKTSKTRQRDAVIVADDAGAGYYSDVRTSFIGLDDARAGDVVAFESEIESNGDTLEDRWPFEHVIPMCRSRFVLELPSGWTHEERWSSAKKIAPVVEGRTRTWEVRDVPPVRVEPLMPSIHAVAGWLNVRMVGGTRDVAERSTRLESWDSLGRWYASRTASLREPDLFVQKAAEAAPPGIASLAAIAQRDVRYVAIELGTGSYIPRAAPEVLAKKFGDCKDKATLLAALLEARKIDARYVLVNNERGATVATVPSMVAFNHVIVAIPAAGLDPALMPAVAGHERLGSLLYFDPTDPLTPFGRLPPDLEGSLALLVDAEKSELVTLPSSPPEGNLQKRTVDATIAPDGSLRGTARFELIGAPARDLRERLTGVSPLERESVVKAPLLGAVPGLTLSSLVIEGLTDTAAPLVLRFEIAAPRFAALGNKLVTIRRSLFDDGAASDSLFAKRRYQPIVLRSPLRVENETTLALPAGIEATEIPEAVMVTGSSATLECSTTFAGSTLRTVEVATHRTREILPADLETMRSFHRKVREVERSQVLLERPQPTP